MLDRLHNWFRSPDPSHVWLVVLTELAIAAAIGVLIYGVLSRLFERIVRRTPWGLDDAFFAHLLAPARFAIPLLLMTIARGRQRLTDPELFAWPLVDRLLQLAVIGVATWVAMRIVSAMADFVRKRHRIDVADNASARRVHTQVSVIAHSVRALIVILGLASALMTFPLVQQVGVSLLASAGLAGLAIGLAARPVLENLIAGVQIGITQPVRIDDVVVIDGTQGKVEEITLTYIVLKVWDERRLIVPFSKVIASSFENWTRRGSRMVGTASLWLDFRADIDAIKAEARRVVEASPLWDRQTFNAQLTDANDRAVLFRVVFSAGSSGDAFNLGVEVREKLIAFIQRSQPEALPRNRIASTDSVET